MRTLIFTVGALLLASTTQIRGQILDSIRTPDKAVGITNQTLEGTWLMELRRPGQPGNVPPVLNLITSHADGTVTGSSGDGTQSAAHGVWVRVGDRKFLQTMFVFAFNESRAITNITKVRINVQMGIDGQTMKGTTEVVVMDRDGNVMATIPGGSYSGLRLTPEMPADFDDFQKNQ